MATTKLHTDTYLFECHFAAFRSFVEEQSLMPFVTFASHPYSEEHEGYKYKIYRTASDMLTSQFLKKSDIGCSKILEEVNNQCSQNQTNRRGEL